jgi:hypothetical protein
MSVTVLVGIDDSHVGEMEVAWGSWRLNRAQILGERLMFVCDRAGGSWRDWSRRLSFCDHPEITAIMWDGDHLREQGADQREVMLTGLVWAAARIKTTHYVKIDTDTVAVQPGEWIDPEWTDETYAFTSHRWGYTRPSSFISALDDWSETVPELAGGNPPVKSLPDNPRARVRHRRIQSWFLLGTTRFARLVWGMIERGGGRMPCPSQDTILWYVAERMGWPYQRVNLKARGWDHGRHALKRWHRCDEK